MNTFQRSDLIKVTKLHWGKNRLGGIFINEENWLARREGALGLVMGMNALANDVYFVAHCKEGKPTMAVYGADEIESVEDRPAKMNLLLELKRAQLRSSKE